MVKHKEIYMEAFDLSPEERVPCEWCCMQPAVDVHHIDMKGMGGRMGKDYIENLVGLCRTCHDKAHRDPETNQLMKVFGAGMSKRKRAMRKLMYGG